MTRFTTKTHISRLLSDAAKELRDARYFLSAKGERVSVGHEAGWATSIALKRAREAATDAEEAVTCIEERMREQGLEVPSPGSEYQP